jgi:hypothetical protein
VVFRPAAGARVVLQGLSFGAGGDPVAGPDFITVRGMETSYKGSAPGARNQRGVFVGPGSSHIQLESMDVGSVDSWFADNLVVRSSDLGPCDAVVDNVCGNNKQDVSTNVLFEQNVIHDLNYDPSNVGAHWECMYLNGGRNVTIRSNVFRGCAIFDIFATISGPDARAIGHENLTIENNWFEKAWTENGQNRDTAIVLGAGCQASVQPALRNVTVRFNSFQAGAGIVTDNAYSAGCQYQNVQIVGNIGNFQGCTNTWAYSYNLWTGGTCSASDRSVSGMPYTSATNFHLTGGLAVDFVPTSIGCPASDFDGQARPQGAACDAGSDER